MVFFLSLLVFLSCYGLVESDCGKGEYETEGIAFGWFTRCKDCQVGTYNNVVGEECKACDGGTYAGEEGAEHCISCPRGQYTDTVGSTECTQCPQGTYTNTKGATQCDPCPAGSYNDKQGQVQCVECGAGHYSTLGAVQCTPCELGDTSPAGSTNSSACTSHCSGGYMHVVTNETHTLCEECPAGSYSELGAVNCTLCTTGTYSVNGSDRCTPCPPGTYNTIDGAENCSLCESGYYSNITHCEQCPDNMTSETGAASPEDCYLAESESEASEPAPVPDILSNTSKSSAGPSVTLVCYIIAGVLTLAVIVGMAVVVWKNRKSTDKLGELGTSVMFSRAETYCNDYGTCDNEGKEEEEDEEKKG